MRVPENRISFNAIAEAFLAAHLGGRAEPIGQDFAGAKFEVGEGASHVPGLEAALASSGGAGRSTAARCGPTAVAAACGDRRGRAASATAPPSGCGDMGAV